MQQTNLVVFPPQSPSDLHKVLNQQTIGQMHVFLVGVSSRTLSRTPFVSPFQGRRRSLGGGDETGGAQRLGARRGVGAVSRTAAQHHRQLLTGARSKLTRLVLRL